MNPAIKQTVNVRVNAFDVVFNCYGTSSELCRLIFKDSLPKEMNKFFSTYFDRSRQQNQVFFFKVDEIYISEKAKLLFLKFTILHQARPFYSETVPLDEEQTALLLDQFENYSSDIEGGNYIAFMTGLGFCNQLTKLKFICLLMSQYCKIYDAGIEASNLGLVSLCQSFALDMNENYKFKYVFYFRHEKFNQNFFFEFQLRLDEMAHKYYITKYSQHVINDISINAYQQELTRIENERQKKEGR